MICSTLRNRSTLNLSSGIWLLGVIIILLLNHCTALLNIIANLSSLIHITITWSISILFLRYWLRCGIYHWLLWFLWTIHPIWLSMNLRIWNILNATLTILCILGWNRSWCICAISFLFYWFFILNLGLICWSFSIGWLLLLHLLRLYLTIAGRARIFFLILGYRVRRFWLRLSLLWFSGNWFSLNFIWNTKLWIHFLFKFLCLFNFSFSNNLI